MPELPEVQTIVDVLGASLEGEVIESIDFRYPRLLEEDSPFMMETLIGKRFTGFKRRGKYLWFELSEGYHWILHLRMEGKFNLYAEKTLPDKHTHLIIKTEHVWVHYLDVRKFSRMCVTRDPDAYFKQKHLGIEPLSSELSVEYLSQTIQTSQRAIKTLLLDQHYVVGIGNIYADEILFDTRIHPLTRGSSLSSDALHNLTQSIPKILEHAIKAGGTTVRTYTSALNVSGRFQVLLNAYGRNGEACRRCGTRMQREVIGGRSSVYCPTCQKVIL